MVRAAKYDHNVIGMELEAIEASALYTNPTNIVTGEIFVALIEPLGEISNYKGICDCCTKYGGFFVVPFCQFRTASCIQFKAAFLNC